MTPHVTLGLFVWVLANQSGVPVPVAPWLLALGALAHGGSLSLTVVLAITVGAALAADLVWYGFGRWRGAVALAACVRLLRLPPATVDRVGGAFRTHQLGFVWSARFLPELNPVAAGLAGATRVRLARFLQHAVGSALAWAGAWIGGGYLLGGATAGLRDLVDIPTTVLIAVALAAAPVSVLALIGWSRGRPADAADAATAHVASSWRLRAGPTTDMASTDSSLTDTGVASARARLGQAVTVA